MALFYPCISNNKINDWVVLIFKLKKGRYMVPELCRLGIMMLIIELIL